MSIRVQTQDDVDFGVMAAEVTVTHFRIQENDGSNPVILPLSGGGRTIPAGQKLQLLSGDLDFIYPAGGFNNAHMRAVVEPYYSGETFKLDILTDAATVVNDAGYSQQTYSNFGITEEDD